MLPFTCQRSSHDHHIHRRPYSLIVLVRRRLHARSHTAKLWYTTGSCKWPRRSDPPEQITRVVDPPLMYIPVSPASSEDLLVWLKELENRYHRRFGSGSSGAELPICHTHKFFLQRSLQHLSLISTQSATGYTVGVLLRQYALGSRPLFHIALTQRHSELLN